ncbi:hypothetical protein ACE6H2_028031 [Prunus campanulata]
MTDPGIVFVGSLVLFAAGGAGSLFHSIRGDLLDDLNTTLLHSRRLRDIRRKSLGKEVSEMNRSHSRLNSHGEMDSFA